MNVIPDEVCAYCGADPIYKREDAPMDWAGEDLDWIPVDCSNSQCEPDMTWTVVPRSDWVAGS